MASSIEVLNLAKQSFYDNKPTAMLQLTSPQSITTSTNTQISWTSAVYDNWSGWSAGSATRYTVQVAGMYRIDASALWSTNLAGGLRDIQLYYNGALIGPSVSSFQTPPITGTFTQSAIPVHQQAAVGDYFQTNIFQSSGSTLAVGNVSTMLIEWLHF